MPHAALKLVGGVNTNETPALNENAGISQSNLIRFFYDPNGVSLIQKLGGWTKFFATQIAAIVRAIWVWEDLNLNANLAFGTAGIGSTGASQLAVITANTLNDITPATATSTIAPVIAATVGSPSLIITDATTTGITNTNTVYIPTQIAVGGIMLFGLY